MATIFIDGRQYQVRDGINLLDASLSLGLDLPYFCWHPAMGSVGACRQCAVKQFRDEHDTRGRLVMACMTPASDGARISIQHPDAREFRRSVAEWLMVHHPHDCPVCDEGGECHLQDMTVMNGDTYRRYRGLKRTFRNQDLGPLVNQEMNRCIQCYRCVRFYRGYAGGRDFDAFFLRDRVFFGRQSDGVLESEFAGNLVEVCPTGVFTDKTLKQHYTRKWDERTAPSICVHCSIGCNTIPGERYGVLRRIRNRYNGDVNGYFLCDRGRYGYEFVNGPRRLRRPLVLGEPAAAPLALERAAAALASGRTIGIGSPRASLEANFALRTLVGPDRFSTGSAAAEQQLVAKVLSILRDGPVAAASLHDVEQSDAVLVLGEDVSNTAPMLALTLRQAARRQPMAAAAKLRIPEWDDAAIREAIQDARGPLYVATTAATRLDELATGTLRAAPDDLARFGFAVAHAIDPAAADAAVEPSIRPHVVEVARALREAARPLVVAGTGSGSEPMVDAAANVAWALHRAGRQVRLALLVSECNSLGAALLGGRSLDEMLDAVERGEADTLVIVENDLFRRTSGARLARLLDRVRLIVVDHLLTPTAARAVVALPAGTFAEADGTLVSYEARAQRFFQVFAPTGEVQESWRWVCDLMAAIGRGRSWQTLDEVTAALAAEVPALAVARNVAPRADFRIAGLKIAREPHRYSGRTAMLANVTVHEPKPPDDPDTALSFTMEGYQGIPPGALTPRFWEPGWNSVQSLNFYQEGADGPLRGGNPGTRVFEASPEATATYFDRVPAGFQPATDWLCVPLHHVFGSEELSALAPGVASLMPQPYVAINPGDLVRIDLREGDVATVTLDGDSYRLPVRAWPSLPRGVAGLPAGLPSVPWTAAPCRVRIAPAESAP